ncbi:hypothetical protein [Rhodovulum euryhalinum]|uniref:Secreted protein n=1 Tax=Rhodovulum euryhalinum TaxID=35805 RepID=A0A4R2K9H3_9RHOB|nr:hypothetical protein [Rhodovulum euryhalinum]TCO70061.1 hypothetical protein EV655_1113 [Rhodovulum euryhalinum]
MTNLLKTAALVAALAAPGAGHGASLGVVTAGETSLGAGSFDYVPDFDDLSSVDTAFASGPLAPAAAFIAITIGAPAAVFDFGSGTAPEVLDMGFTDDRMEFLLGAFTGFANGAPVTLPAGAVPLLTGLGDITALRRRR